MMLLAVSSLSCDLLAEKVHPAMLKSRSQGVLVAGMHRYLRANFASLG